MKIEIEIDIEAIVTRAIEKHIAENLVIINKSGETKVTIKEETSATSQKVNTSTAPKSESENTSGNVSRFSKEPPAGIKWEFAPQPGRRRSPEQVKLHEKELELERNLTPEEKGMIRGNLEVEETKEEAAKQKAIEQAKIQDITEKVTAVKQELEEEEKQKSATPIVDNLFAKETPEETEEVPAVTIPETEPLDNLDSLFK